MSLVKSKPTLTDAVRQACLSSGRTRRELASSIDCSEAAFSRFLSRERGMSLERLDRLAAVLGLRVVQDAKHRKRK